MLPGDEVALFDGALLGMAALALEKKFHALTPALPANRADVSCQFLLLTFLTSGAVYSHWGPSSRLLTKIFSTQRR
jgi:hypothetical protein